MVLPRFLALVVLLGAGLAAEAAERREVRVPLPTEVHGLTWLEASGHPLVVAVGTRSTYVVDASTGRVHATLPGARTAAVLSDPPALLLCGPDGLRRVPVDSRGLGVTTTVDTAPCAGVGVGRLAGDDPEVITAGESLVRWTVARDGSLERVGPLHDPLELAERGVDPGRALPTVDTPYLDGDGCRDLVSVASGQALEVVLAACEVGPPVPVVRVGDDPVRVRAPVGRPLELKLVTERGAPRRWSGRGGPPGLVVFPNGTVSYVPEPLHAGPWEVEVRATAPGRLPRKGLLVVEVVTGDAAVAVGDAAGLADPWAEAAPVREEWAPYYTFWDLRRVVVGAGVAVALSGARESWVHQGDHVWSGSPVLSVLAEGWEGWLGWYAGLDSAPTLVHLTRADWPDHHRVSLLAGLQLGDEDIRAGVHLQAGISLVAVGLRVQALSLRSGSLAHGPELRAIRYVRSAPSGMVALGWTARAWSR